MGRNLAAVVALLALILAVFWPVGGHRFINFDDPTYLIDNPLVNQGLTWESMKNAFSSAPNDNWHPLTWLSHMADVELFGMRAGRHHLVSLGWHAANAVLLFFVLISLTGAWWRSFIGAALFAAHPLRVETVAWASERKDVLSAFFFLAAIWLYARHTRRPGGWRYLAVAAAFVLGLLSKPMVITLPLVLLLLDFWPLGRPGTVPWGRLIAEKIPLLSLSAASGTITYLVQSRQSVKNWVEYPLAARLGNALWSYGAYLWRTAWPVRLAVFYPHPGGGLPWWQAALAGTLLVMATVLMARQRQRRPWLVMGWAWYLVMLVPVIGLVQVGLQGTADRYTYLPLIGIFIMAVWGVDDLFGRRKAKRFLTAAAGAAVVMALGWRAHVQVGYWRDSETLLHRALAVTENNFVAHALLAEALLDQRKLDEALQEFYRSYRIKSDNEIVRWYLIRYREVFPHPLPDDYPTKQ